MFHDYEFLLRYLEHGNNVYVIPKLTYRHVNGRDGSIIGDMKDVNDFEKKWWYDLAKKEYHFDYDRQLEYEE